MDAIAELLAATREKGKDRLFFTADCKTTLEAEAEYVAREAGANSENT